MADDQYVDIVEVFKGKDKQWYYRAQSNNGEILFTSEGYVDKSDAVKYAGDIAEMHAASVEVKGE
jgi:uncharacterized protein YegP (UPF0339 family)